ncbi:dioxygenase-like protein [Byssothecium circinans]|uniref:Dioxygenase-like protein n=1 Tax=Byssothecium circinans TaxID=147558 RepID=A0A6A5TV67_9PLEO|nr:dioxygenase-like protein [Byssothecium circinans]
MLRASGVEMSCSSVQHLTSRHSRGALSLAVAYDDKVHDTSKYAAYLPVYDTTTKFPPTELFDFDDRGHHADLAKPNLLGRDNTGLKVSKLTPRVGTEITGLQLSHLTDAQKDELALLIVERGVVKQKEFGKYFGRLHVHPVGAHVKDHIEFHSIYLGKDNLYRLGRSTSKLTTTGYHSDVSYEHQPSGITLLTLVQVPETGGDTGWTSQAAAYDRLSEPLKAFLEGLRAEHSGFPQAGRAARDGHFVRRDPVKSFHPIVRVHLVTKQKVLFVNPGFTKRIVGLKDEESDAILKLLFKHIAQSQDIQARVKWDDRTVALWDNRVTAHTAISDYDVADEGEGLRQGFRITTLAEVPEGVNGLRSEWE